MGAQLRVYRRRMRSVKATKKITKAMELISASRIVKAQQRVSASTPYANELTRAVSAVATYSSMYVTMNARALMNFLSLRTTAEGSHFPSYPQREIEMVAEKMEEFFKEKMPLVHAAFNKSGRVSP